MPKSYAEKRFEAELSKKTYPQILNEITSGTQLNNEEKKAAIIQAFKAEKRKIEIDALIIERGACTDTFDGSELGMFQVIPLTEAAFEKFLTRDDLEQAKAQLGLPKPAKEGETRTDSMKRRIQTTFAYLGIRTQSQPEPEPEPQQHISPKP
jgi:hypothetical protein